MEWWRCRGEGSSRVKELLLESEQTGILDHFGHSYIYSLDVLNTILKEESLEWTVTETASVQDKHFTYTLSDSEQKMICLISTAKGNGDGRFLQIAFLSSPTNISTVLPYENWGRAITLAQMLYGNFQSKTTDCLWSPLFCMTLMSL